MHDSAECRAKDRHKDNVAIPNGSVHIRGKEEVSATALLNDLTSGSQVAVVASCYYGEDIFAMLLLIYTIEEKCSSSESRRARLRVCPERKMYIVYAHIHRKSQKITMSLEEAILRSSLHASGQIE